MSRQSSAAQSMTRILGRCRTCRSKNPQVSGISGTTGRSTFVRLTTRSAGSCTTRARWPGTRSVSLTIVVLRRLVELDLTEAGEPGADLPAEDRSLHHRVLLEGELCPRTQADGNIWLGGRSKSPCVGSWKLAGHKDFGSFCRPKRNGMKAIVAHDALLIVIGTIAATADDDCCSKRARLSQHVYRVAHRHRHRESPAVAGLWLLGR